MNKTLAKRINHMAREDQKMREGHRKDAKLNILVDKRHTNDLKKIVKKYGWPTISLVGGKASYNAWLLTQHADHDRKFQETILKLLKTIYTKTHDIDPANIAYLTDRLLVAKNKNQRFGTQFNYDENGRLILHPIKNLKIIKRIRKEYNLPPLEDFIKMAKEFNIKLKIKK